MLKKRQKMKKIAIITIYDKTNYGNRLQNIALYNILSKFGETETLVISLDGKLKFKAKHLKNKLESKTGIQITKKGIHVKSKIERVKYNNFNKFENMNKVRCICCDSIQDMKKIFEEYDYCFIGSDQVWNPIFWDYENPDKLFAQFLLKDVTTEKRIAISASFGTNSLPEIWISPFSSQLKQFKRISVRENSGEKIVKYLTGKDCPVLIDPTLAANESIWKKAIGCSSLRYIPPKYILKYFLDKETSDVNSRISQISKMNKMSICALNDIEDPNYYVSGPCEFLHLFEKAQLICTDSFHAVAFSMIFRKPFIVFPRNNAKLNMSDRIITLLSEFGLTNRMAENINDDEIFNCDFSILEKELAKKKKCFMDFISDAIS